jgi:flagellar P-ring protein FlgI
MKNILFLICLIPSLSFAVGTRIKNLVTIKGVRQSPIIGYGLVVGLNGTGDSSFETTNSSLKTLFQKLGLNPQKEIKSKNVAGVVVTAQLPPFARIGQKADVTISSIGDASSLSGGTLLVTPLKGGNGVIYGIASGKVSIGGLEKKFATTGLVVNGLLIEKELVANFDLQNKIRLTLNNPDFTTAARIERIINQELGGFFAKAIDSGTLDLTIPANYNRKSVELMALVENFKVNVDIPSKIIINERTGTIVSGGDVVLYPVAISHGDLSIEVTDIDKGKKTGGTSTMYIDSKATLKELVEALNKFGAKPEDLISIIEALKRNGSLIGEVELI